MCDFFKTLFIFFGGVNLLSQVSYAIGVAHPLSISVFHYGTSTRQEDELLQIVNNNFDLRPGVIVK